MNVLPNIKQHICYITHNGTCTLNSRPFRPSTGGRDSHCVQLDNLLPEDSHTNVMVHVTNQHTHTKTK